MAGSTNIHFIYLKTIENFWLFPLNYKLNDKGDFMSRKKSIMIFDTWIVLWRPEANWIGLTAENRRVLKAV